MWVRFLGRVTSDTPERFATLLRRAGVNLTFPSGAAEGFGATVFEQVDALEPTFQAGDLVLVRGHVTHFQGKPQILLEALASEEDQPFAATGPEPDPAPGQRRL